MRFLGWAGVPSPRPAHSLEAALGPTAPAAVVVLPWWCCRGGAAVVVRERLGQKLTDPWPSDGV